MWYHKFVPKFSRSNVLQTVVLVVAVVILGVLTFRTPTVNAWVERLVIFSSRSNAAVHYLDAIEALNFPLTVSLQSDVLRVIKDSWHGDQSDIKTLLDANKNVLREIEPALKLDNCDFNFGRELSSINTQPLMAKMNKIVYLMLLNGRRLEGEGKKREAAEQYLDALTVTRHLLQDTNIQTQNMALGLRELTMTPLLKLVNEEPQRSRLVMQVGNYLDRYESTPFSIKGFVASQKELYRESMGVISKHIGPRSTSFDHILKSTSEQMTVQYLGLLERYAEIGDPLLLLQFYLSAHHLRDHYALETPLQTPKQIYLHYQLEINRMTTPEQQQTMAKKLTAQLLNTMMTVDYSRFLFRYERSLSTMESLKQLVKLKQHHV